MKFLELGILCEQDLRPFLLGRAPLVAALGYQVLGPGEEFEDGISVCKFLGAVFPDIDSGIMDILGRLFGRRGKRKPLQPTDNQLIAALFRRRGRDSNSWYGMTRTSV